MFRITFWLGYRYRDIEWKWAAIRVRIFHMLADKCLNLGSYFTEAATRLLDSQDHYHRNKGSNNGHR